MWLSALDNQKLIHSSAIHPSYKLILSALFTLFITGCSTVKVHSYDHEILHPYLGTETALDGFYDSFSDYVIHNQASLMAIDIPFSFVADTLLLPYDAVVWFVRHDD
jgi:uncharacterized protein YceK